MDVFELVGRTEETPAYKDLESANFEILQMFVDALVDAAVELKQPIISTAIIRSFNAHAIACLHSHAGQYRVYPVSVGPHKPEEAGGHLPAHWRVPTLMNDFVNTVNRRWSEQTYLELAAYALWRLNFIHPFQNGNGRTARALCYFVICVKAGGTLPGKKPLTMLIKEEPHRAEYIKLLRRADDKFIKSRVEDLSAMVMFLERLIKLQLLSGYD